VYIKSTKLLISRLLPCAHEPDERVGPGRKHPEGPESAKGRNAVCRRLSVVTLVDDETWNKRSQEIIRFIEFLI
jgi:hypothetical protein